MNNVYLQLTNKAKQCYASHHTTEVTFNTHMKYSKSLFSHCYTDGSLFALIKVLTSINMLFGVE